MGVDYEANYGIGYEVEAGKEIDDSALEDGLAEYLYGEVGDEFSHFETGSYMTGNMTGTYLTLKEPFKNGLDLTEGKALLDKEVIRLKLETSGEFGEVGGLLIC